MPETVLEMATRHVREGEAHIARQRTLVAELRDGRHDAHFIAEAENLLAQFLSLQAQHVAHLKRLQGPRKGT